jgi:hypothetical protein
MHWLSTFQHWLAVHTGTVNEPGVWYGFWSGFGADISEYAILVALSAGLYHSFRRHNCHERGCWRIGLHHVDGTPFIACRKHHPVLKGHKLPKGHMAEAYRLAQEEKHRLAQEGHKLEEKAEGETIRIEKSVHRDLDGGAKPEPA